MLTNPCAFLNRLLRAEEAFREANQCPISGTLWALHNCENLEDLVPTSVYQKRAAEKRKAEEGETLDGAWQGWMTASALTETPANSNYAPIIESNTGDPMAPEAPPPSPEPYWDPTFLERYHSDLLWLSPVTQQQMGILDESADAPFGGGLTLEPVNRALAQDPSSTTPWSDFDYSTDHDALCAVLVDKALATISQPSLFRELYGEWAENDGLDGEGVGNDGLDGEGAGNNGLDFM